ncbi:hypothetical protein OAO62_05865, partial [Gammaproteobacteria bacterium]|nr:hypothetical protein [Gammaproteobacteria bacterium]
GDNVLIVYCLDGKGKIAGFRSALLLKEKAWEFYAATTKEGREMSAGFALLDALTVACSKRGVKRFILPLSRTNYGDTLFKEGSGGNQHKLMGEWEYSNTPFLRIMVNSCLYLLFNSYLVSRFLKRF